ncbi:MAG: TolC family protein [candidate division Zixibacteria bacterium]|nr:TolC family protein [candidate division Zixibacteria bacterium]
MIQSILILIFILIHCNTAGADDTMKLTIEECIDIGIESNPGLHASLMNSKSADASASIANTARFFSINAAASYAKLSEEKPFEIELPSPLSRTFTFSESIVDNYNLRLTFQQPIFTGLKLHNTNKMAKYKANAVREDYNKDKSELIYEIKESYWMLYSAIEYKTAVEENVRQVEFHLKDTQNFLDQGIVTKNEVLKVKVQLLNTQLLLSESEKAVKLSSIALNSLLGFHLDTKIELISVIEYRHDNHIYDESLIKQALENRPELKSMKHLIKASEAGVSLAKSGWYPQIFLAGNFYYLKPNQRIFPPEEKFEDTWDVGLFASFDIWNWGKTVHQTKLAKAQYLKTKDFHSQLIDAVALEVTRNRLEFDQSRDAIDIANQTVEQAEENYRITNDKFKNGIASNSDLLDAEAALLHARTGLTSALVKHELAYARLMKSIG